MKTSYDLQGDALYVGFSDDVIVENDQCRPGIIIDRDGESRVVGIESLSRVRRD